MVPAVARPLVSVVTPTWQRHDLLLGRCVPSVLAQTYLRVEHVIVSDGPDQALMDRAAAAADEWRGHRVSFRYLAEHDPAARWGHRARVFGAAVAHGELIAYLDDDNAFRPDHVAKLAAALEENPGAGFAYSQILMQGNGMSYVVGVPPPSYGQIDTSAIMHRREILNLAQWRDEGQPTIDWDITERWLQAGVGWAHVPEVTADYYFT